MQRTFHFRIFALYAIIIVAADARAGGGLSFQAVALSGQSAPGAPGRIFYFYYPPAIGNSGRVAFKGWLTGVTSNDEGLWSGLPGSIQLVAREGSSAPGTGVVFDMNGWTVPWVNSSGVVAFSSAILGAGVNSTNNTGIWAGTPGAVALVARAGNPAPGTPVGVVFSGGMQNWLMLNDAGELVFRANLTGPGVDSSNDAGIWAGSPGALQLIAREGDIAPGTGGLLFGPFNYQFAEYPVPVLNAAGEVAFAAHHSGGRGIWRWSGGVLDLVTRTGSSAYGMSGTFSDVRDPWMNASGNVVFSASVVGEGIDNTNNAGIWAGVPGAVELVVRKGAPAPGSPGNYLVISGVTNVGLVSIDDGGFVTFPSSTWDGVSVSGPDGIWQYGPGPGTWPGSNLVLEGMPAPGLSFTTIANTQCLGPHPVTSIPFPATLSGTGVSADNNDSLWLKDVGSPSALILREGDLFDTGGGTMQTIGTIVATNSGPCYNADRQIVIGLGFAGGSSGIFTANVPVPTTPGDMNCDGAVDGLDIDGFGLAVLDPAGYAAELPGCNILNGDINLDSMTDIADTDLFVTCVLTGGCP